MSLFYRKTCGCVVIYRNKDKNHIFCYNKNREECCCHASGKMTVTGVKDVGAWSCWKEEVL